MTRLARTVIANTPHHVTQRGNRRQPTFFQDSDYVAYLNLMAEWCLKSGVEIWAYCLMPNHVHLLAVPVGEEALRIAIGEAHRRYTLLINKRMGWTGHLWQGRFASFVMDEPHLLRAARYIELNPVRAKLVQNPFHWPWSSARAHISGQNDQLAVVKPLLERVTEWTEFLNVIDRPMEMELLRKHERTGRPLGDKVFIERLEQKTGRILKPLKRGPKITQKGI